MNFCRTAAPCAGVAVQHSYIHHHNHATPDLLLRKATYYLQAAPAGDADESKEKR